MEIIDIIYNNWALDIHVVCPKDTAYQEFL